MCREGGAAAESHRVFLVILFSCNRFVNFADAFFEALLEIFESFGEAFDAFFELVAGHAVGGVHLVEGGLVHGDLFDLEVLGFRCVELAGKGALGSFKLAEKLGSDGEEIAACEFDNFAGVAEACAHDDGLVTKMFVVVVNRGDGLDTGVVRAGVVLTGVFLVPVENAADEWRDESDLSFCGCDGLMNAERRVMLQ